VPVSSPFLAEYELAERDMRAFRRHLNEAKLPAGNIGNLRLQGPANLPRARIEALQQGDWLRRRRQP